MIAAVIVVLSVLLASIFAVAYLVKPALRKQVEAPKYHFQAQIQQYNEQSQPESEPSDN